MKTKKFLELQERLLPNFPGFSIKGDLLLLSPLEGTLRGFYFEPSAFAKQIFYVNMFFLPLCIPAKRVHFTFGHRIGAGKRWSMEDPDLDVALSSEMLKEVPFLRGLRTPGDVAAALEEFANRSNPHCHEAFAYVLIQAGEIDRAEAVLRNLLELIDYSIAWQQEIAFRVQPIKENLLTNPQEAQKQLTTWETETVSNLELDTSVDPRGWPT